MNQERRELVVVKSDTKLTEVAELLAEQNILSVPVKDSNSDAFLGWIDTLELVRFATMELKDTQKKYENSFATELFTSLDISQATAGDALRHTSRKIARDVLVFPSNTTLESTLQTLTSKSSEHRILVRQGGSSDLTLVSQTDLVKYLLERKKDLGQEHNKGINEATLTELGLVNPLGSPVAVIPVFASAMRGFLMMVDENIYGVGVLDEEGKLAANLSASDLRGMTPDKVCTLNLPVLEFFKTLGVKPIHPIVCTAECSLEEVMTRAITAHVHRVWVVDSAQRPIGVVTLTDMLQTILALRTSQQS